MPVLMEGAARTRLVTLVVLLVVAVPLTIVAVAGSGGSDDEGGELRVERSVEVPEVRVFVTPDANRAERAGGQATVTVECLDRDGAVVASQPAPWPFTDTDDGTLDPHTHVPVDPERLNDLARCRLLRTKPPLAGPVS
jgi:hypothetical protein